MRTTTLFGGTLAGALFFVACQPSGAPAQQQKALIRSNQPLYAFQAAWPKRDAPEIAFKAQRVAETIKGGSLPSAAFAASVAGQDLSASLLMFEPIEGISVSYHPQKDDLRVDDLKVSEDGSPGNDIGQAAARAKFEETFSALAKDGTINGADYDLAKTDLAYRKAGSAPAGQRATPYVVSYIFTVLRQINGIPFANAGVRVGVHRSGRVAWIRLGGAEISSVRVDSTEQPAETAALLARAVADEDLLARFGREVSNGRVVWSRLMYAMPEKGTSAQIEPKYLVSHVGRFTSEGREVLSRRQLLAYSIRDGAAAPENLGPTPNPNSQGDPRP